MVFDNTAIRYATGTRSSPFSVARANVLAPSHFSAAVFSLLCFFFY